MTTRVTILHVPDCPNLAPLQQRLTRVLGNRVDVEVELCLITSENAAARDGMAGSPTLLIDGIDPFAAPAQTPSLSCRLYRDEAGIITGAPSLAQLQAALSTITAHTQAAAPSPAGDGECCLTPEQQGGTAGRLADRRARNTPRDPAAKAVHARILRAFASTGRPPTRDELADVATAQNTNVDQVLAGLHAEDIIRLDSVGDIAVAYPFSTTPTPHQVRLASGVTVSAMCAIDALGIPAMLGTDAVISTDPATAAPVTVTSRAGRFHWDPAEAVVFLSANADGGPSADNCCATLNFFTSHHSARTWIARNPQIPGEILTPTAAEQLGQRIFGTLLTER